MPADPEQSVSAEAEDEKLQAEAEQLAKAREVNEKLQAHLAKGEATRKAGNDLLQKGDYADACLKYDEGLLALCHVGEPLKKEANELRVALHLNNSLAHFRRGNLRAAIDHGSGAITIDPQNEKAFFRRGSALARLSEHPGHEAEVKRALEDFMKVLVLNPANTEALKQLRVLKNQVQKEEKGMEKAQGDLYKNMFKDGTNLYAADHGEEKVVAPKIHADKAAEEAVENSRVLGIEQLCYHYVRGEPILKNINLDLCKGRCVGLFGANASGKSTLARILTGKYSPTSGRVLQCGSVRPPAPCSLIIITVVSSPFVAMAAIFVGVLNSVLNGLTLDHAAISTIESLTQFDFAKVALACVVVSYLIKLVLDAYFRRYARHLVLHLASDTSDKERPGMNVTVEKLIGGYLPGKLSRDERRKRVIAMLKAAGFQCYDQTTSKPVGSPEEYIKDGMMYGTLSGGQQHLMYVLRCLASRPDVLICDEVLGGLDAVRQPRVLHMIRRMKEDLGMSILFIGTELSQLRLMSESIGFLSPEGTIAEIGPADQILDLPKHPHTKDYISSYRGLPGCHIIGGKLAENYMALKNDEDIAGDWLP